MLYKTIILLLATTVIGENITSCHFHGSDYYCIDSEGTEGQVVPAPTEEDAVSSYTLCHNHGEATYCMNGSDEVEFTTSTEDEASHEEEGEEHTEEGEEHTHEEEDEEHTHEGEEEEEEMDCHFHAGVEHCVPKSGSSSASSAQTCARSDRDYNIPLRIGLIFAMLAATALGSFGPLMLKSFLKVNTDGIIFSVCKQFGTGIIISTAFVHLLTHAMLMFGNECLTGIHYEATAAAITMAGLFIAFLFEYVCKRLADSRKTLISSNNVDENEDAKDVSSQSVEEDSVIVAEDKISVLLLEAGIIFHSILIGVTAVVAADSYFITLFIVIIFHQFFEGLALGARIAALPNTSIIYKCLLACAFAVTTPVGMAIGTGVLHSFNGNDPTTVIVMGTLDAFSAGILVWIGVVGMWAHDWIHGPLARTSWVHTIINLFALVVGFILMSLLGKWA